MADSTIQQIKDRLDIVEVVSGYLKLEKTGINLRANCPFHGEKTPSFFVSPSRQMFKCFGCGAGGDVFQFIMQMEGIEFGDALRMLARRAGVELPTYHPEIQTKRNRLYEISEISCRFFEKQLNSSQAGQQVLKYLMGRGLTAESIKQWRIGYAPDQWRALSDFLVGQGYQRAEILEAGLAVASEKGGDSYDRFRGRIIFPVPDLNSQVVGFGGRLCPAGFGDPKAGKDAGKELGAKYINSPATPLYDKSRVLYGLNFAKLATRPKDACILTEGYMDVILAHQASFSNTVASSGTALTNQHLKTIKRYTNNLLFAFDADAGGDSATQRGIDLALAEEFNVKVIVMPPGLDPADIISKNPQDWDKYLEGAKDVVAFYFDAALSRFNKSTAAGKQQIGQFILPVLKKISNSIVRAHWVQRLADVLGVSETSVMEELAKIKIDNIKSNTAALLNPQSNIKSKSRRHILEERIASLVLFCPQGLDFIDHSHLEFFSLTNAKEIIMALKASPVDSPEAAQAVCRKLGEQKEMADFLSEVSFWAEAQPVEDVFSEIQLCLEQLKGLANRKNLQELSQGIRQAEAENNVEKLNDLMGQFNQLSKEIV